MMASVRQGALPDMPFLEESFGATSLTILSPIEMVMLNEAFFWSGTNRPPLVRAKQRWTRSEWRVSTAIENWCP